MINTAQSAILIIDDDPTFNGILVRSLRRRGYPAEGALNTVDALVKAKTMLATHIVLDLNLAGASGLALIPQLLAINPACRIVVLTGYASIATAVDAIKQGAIQYLAKPVELNAILSALNEAADHNQALATPTDPLSVDRLTWEHIQRVLNEHAGNVSATARALKMHRRTLQRKLLKHPTRS